MEKPTRRKIRQTFFPPELDDMMRAVMEGKGPLDLLFPAPMGGLLRRSNFGKRVWQPAHKAAGWSPEWTFGTTRHVAAAWMLEIWKLGDADVAALLDHSSSAFTRRVYAQAMHGSAERAVTAAQRALEAASH